MATERRALDQAAGLGDRPAAADGQGGGGAAAPATPAQPYAPGTQAPGANGTAGRPGGYGGPGGGAAAPPAPRARIPRRIVVPIAIVVVVAAIAFGVRYAIDQALYVSTDNAQVSGALIQVGSINAGRIASVSVDVGSAVHRDEQVATVTLPSTMTVTDTGTPKLGFRGTEDLQAPVTSPIDGVVVQRLGNPGDTVAQGQAIVTVVDPSQLWVQAQIEETKIDRVRVGQPVDVHVDTLGKTLPGEVMALDRSTSASFSLLPQTTTSGNFTKVTQLVPVKIHVDYTSKDPLTLGSSVEVKIHVS